MIEPPIISSMLIPSPMKPGYMKEKYQNKDLQVNVRSGTMGLKLKAIRSLTTYLLQIVSRRWALKKVLKKHPSQEPMMCFDWKIEFHKESKTFWYGNMKQGKAGKDHLFECVTL
jgi:hypothetical protein